MSDDIGSMTLVEVAAAIRQRKLSSVEATRACLARIERRQKVLNCFISIEPDDALAQAEQADREIAAGRWRGPLHGAPLAHKDMFYRAGKVSTCGSKIYRDHVANVTSTVQERMAEAGAVYLGSLNMSEFAAGPTGHNEYFGHCRNPWNPEHVTGGSSSGSGCALAARLIFASLGSDTGGSIRLPAAMCGVVGLKPTHGLVSRYGVMPRCWSLDIVGPLARTAEDCALLLQVVAGPDGKDPITAGHAIPDYHAALARGVKGMRIAVPTNAMFKDIDATVKAAHDESLRTLRTLGAEVIEVELPDPRITYALTNLVNKAEAATIHAQWVRTRRDEYSLSAVNRVEAGYHIPATQYLDATRLRARLLQEFVQRVFDRADAVHMPVIGMPVPTIVDTEIRSTAQVPQLMERVTRFTRWVNYLGLPALSVPCGFTPDGLPVAMQLLGRPFAEARLLALGHAYQSCTDWHKRSPPELPASRATQRA
ncbi:MAG TPA: amidase [Casimicrobiaceae bacterium]|nr:amidase [Casimicrobiaceae bacterium]